MANIPLDKDRNLHRRFMVRPNFTPTTDPLSKHDEDLENAILTTARDRFPLNRVLYPRISTYIPSAATLLVYLNQMDTTMAYTRQWTNKGLGWAPPLSQIYVSVLFYVQVMRAMYAARAFPICSDISVLLKDFLSCYPIEHLWIPGPLVSYFKNLSCFSFNDQYGYVTPALPNKPGWSADTNFCFDIKSFALLPNISIFISRMRSICKMASRQNVADHSFCEDVDGPAYLSHLFSQPCNHTNNEEAILCSPGASLAYVESLRIWRDPTLLESLDDLPSDLDIAEQDVDDTWLAALRLNSGTNWFANVITIMSNYCQFWNGSVTLNDCHPNGSTTGAIRCSEVNGNLFHVPEWNNGSADKIGHYTMRQEPTITFDTSCVLPDVPQVQLLAALTFQHHIVPNAVSIVEVCSGPFWDIQPIATRGENITVCQGVSATIATKYRWIERDGQ